LPARSLSIEFAGGKKPPTTKIAGRLSLEDILLDLDASSKGELFAQIAEHMGRKHGIPHESVAMSLSCRERISSTGLGEGVAIPHARIQDLDQVWVLYARLTAPIPFDAPDGNPVSSALVLMVPKQATEEQLTVLTEATRLLFGRRFRAELKRCKQRHEIKQLFDTWPRNRIGH
jgi:nitrogen PTS system EIIA component